MPRSAHWRKVDLHWRVEGSDAGHDKALTFVREVEHGPTAVVVAGERYRKQGEDGDIKSPVNRTKNVEQLARPAYKPLIDGFTLLVAPRKTYRFC